MVNVHVSFVLAVLVLTLKPVVESTTSVGAILVKPSSLVKEVDDLDRSIFDDGRSIQFSSLDTMPRMRPRPFDPEELVSSILRTAREDMNYVLTVDDYIALRDSRSSES